VTTKIDLTATANFMLRVADHYVDHLRKQYPQYRLCRPHVELSMSVGSSEARGTIEVSFKRYMRGRILIDPMMITMDQAPTCSFQAEHTFHVDGDWTERVRNHVFAVEDDFGDIKLVVNALDQVAATPA
jgi:hypothetical protein